MLMCRGDQYELTEEKYCQNQDSVYPCQTQIDYRKIWLDYFLSYQH